MPPKRLLLLLILLLALGVRLARLTSVPPGLTHDEANHAREAIGVLDGDLRYYLPYNSGSEPIYSYTVAGAMALLGENLLALRLVNVLFGVAAIGVAALWAERVLGRDTALVAAALLAVSFWPLATSRQALRAGMLPFFVTGAVWFFWQMWARVQPARRAAVRAPWLGFAICLAAALHVYLAARVAWLIFPLFLAYLALVHRDAFRRLWPATLSGLALTALLVTPMFLYLRRNPAIQPRLTMLDGPLGALRAGDPGPVLRHAGQAALALVWPGSGDAFLAYNIPGRPTLETLTAVFFVLGLLTALRRWRQPAYAFLLLWLGVGILPSLITGPTANTTRNLAALPAVYLLPAVGFTAAMAAVRPQLPAAGRRVGPPALAALWLTLAGSGAAVDYFGRWARLPEVRGAYQVTQLAMLEYLAAQPDAGPAVISTVYPGPAHDPSIALLVAPELDLRWVDARWALVFPGGAGGQAVIPVSTPPHAALAGWLQPLDTVTMPAGDLDPAFTRYVLAPPPPAWLADPPAADPPLADFDGAVWLRATGWWRPDGGPAGLVRPGETAVMRTVWQVQDPARVGPPAPPADTPDVVLFTQVLRAGQVLAQRDALDAPSWSWRRGDLVVQLHPVTVPAQTPPGEYATIVGLYDRRSGTRLPVVDEQGRAGDSFAPAPPLQVIEP